MKFCPDEWMNDYIVSIILDSFDNLEQRKGTHIQESSKAEMFSCM
jgi:hypothetical protein